MEFSVPQHPEDLETADGNRVSVAVVLDVESCQNIDAVLDAVAAAVSDSNNVFETVVSHDVFDKVYSFIKFWSCHGGSTKQRVIELLVSMVQDVIGAIGEAKSSGSSPADTSREMALRRTAFKATAYLYAICVQVADKTSVPVGSDSLGAVKKGRKAAGKGKGKKRADDDDAEDDAGEDGSATDANSWDWPALREPCLRLLTDMLCVDPRKLWPLGVAEEEIIGVVVKTGARVLGNSVAMKDKACRRAVVEVLACACARYPSVGTSTVVAVVDAVSKAEHAVGCAVDLAELMSSGLSVGAEGVQGQSAQMPYGGKFFAPHTAGELLREVGRVNAVSTGSVASAGSADAATGGLKRASAFIMEVSERCPALVLGNLACLLPHLDSDNATLRSALVTTLGNIVARSYNSATAEAAAKAAATAATASGGDPAAAAAEAAAFSTRTRDALLDALAERIHDVHSYTRAAALRAWCSLAASNAVPLDRFQPLTILATGRLKDKGAIVRKMAVQLLRTLLENNPFGARVDPAVFSAQLATVHHWLAANAPAAVFAQLTGEATPPPSAQEGLTLTSGKKKMRGIVEDDDEDEGEGEDAVNEALLADSAAAMAAEQAGETGGETVHIAPEVAMYLRYHAQLTAAAGFADAVLPALPCAVEMLSSKSSSDVREAIKLLSRARAFGVPGAEGSLARMLVLVWSDEPGVKDEVIDTFDALYLRNESLGDEDEDEGGPSHAQPLVPAADEAAPARPKRATRLKAGSMAEDDEDGDDFDDGDDDDEDGGKGKGKKKAAGTGKVKAPAVKAAPDEAPTAPAKSKKKRAPRTSSATLDPLLVASTLVGLLSGSSLAVRTSLEEVLREAGAQGLLPPGLGEAMWAMVGNAVAALSRTRIEVGGCLVAVRTGGGATAIPAAMQAVATADGLLARGRAAMSILAMVGGCLPGTLDSVETLGRMLFVLRPDDGTGVPVGAALLRAAVRELTAVTPAGTLPDLRLVEPAMAMGDYRLARHACAALTRIRGYTVAQHPRKVMAGAAAIAETGDKPAGKAKAGKGKGATIPDDSESVERTRASTVYQILGYVTRMVQGAWDGGEVQSAHWFPAAQHGIDAIFILAPQPLALCTPMLRDMAAGLLLDSSGSEPSYLPTLSHARMSRCFFALGHVALRTLAHTEALASRVKLMRIRAAEKAEHSSSTPAVVAAPEAAGGKTKKGEKVASAAPKANSTAKDGIEEQLGVSAAEDEKEAELTSSIAETELAASNLCGLFAPLLKKVIMSHLVAVQGAAEGVAVKADTLTESALLALCKLLAVSSSFCESHLQLLFTVLARSPCPSLRGTIAVALGDLAVRFPNLTEPYTSHMYARLRDDDVVVRKSALMVLTHLILAEQIKVKGNVGEIAVCLNDADPRIADLTRMFFTELSKRSGSPIYNMLPDTLSCLSRLANPQAHASGASAPSSPGIGAAAAAELAATTSLRPLDQETFRDIVRFLLGFVSKDKQSEMLAEKLLNRMQAAESSSGGSAADSLATGVPVMAGGVADDATKALWRDVAYCLSQLPLSDKMVRKLSESVQGYALALADDDVWESFAGMLARARKMLASSGAGAGGPLSKSELREVVDAWEKALHEARSGSVEDDAALLAAKAASRRAKRVAAVEGIDQDAITAAAMAKAREAAVAAAETEAAKKAPKGRGKAAAKSVAVEEDEDDEKAVVRKGGKAAGVAAVPPVAPTRKRKGLVVDSDEEEGANDENKVDKVAVKGKAASSRPSSRASSRGT